MCGLFGFYSKNTTIDTVQLFQELAINSESRGLHATGYAALNEGHIHIHKLPVSASNFTFDRLYLTLPEACLGHVRHATQGNPKDNINNHPFRSKRFAFVHNGSLKLAGQHIPTKSNCDSERMFRLFLKYYSACHVVERAIELMGKEFINESFACCLLDRQTQKIHMFRNSKRPLWIVRIPQMQSIFWASTQEIIDETMKHYGLEYSSFQTKTNTIYTVDNELSIDKQTMNWKEQVYSYKHFYKSSNSVVNEIDGMVKHGVYHADNLSGQFKNTSIY